MKKMKIKNKLYSVVTMTEFTRGGEEIYNPKSTAIDLGNMVLPLKSINTSDNLEPGVYYNDECNMAANIVKPLEEDMDIYDANNIIDFSNPSNIRDIFEKNELVRDIERDILTTKDNILDLKITEEDTPEMRAVKTAINMKQVDKKSYEDRFDQFQNDMRLLKGNTITLSKLISTCDKFDIDATLTLKDKYKDTPNPMGDVIVINLNERK